MATPIHVHGQWLKPKMASVSLADIVFLHPVKRKKKGRKFNGKKIVAQAFVKQIKNDSRVFFGKFLCRVSRELGRSEGHDDNFCVFFYYSSGVTHQIEYKTKNNYF